MLQNGLTFLINPRKLWTESTLTLAKKRNWLIIAAVSATIIPTMCIVSGHLGSYWIGLEDQETAIQRAAIGFLATAIGGIVTASALSLIIFQTSKRARVDIIPYQAQLGAMSLIWPAWFTGVVLVIPPVLGLGPEPGEILWGILALLAAIRVIRATADGLCVGRRWRNRFMTETTISFLFLFIAIPLAPSILLRFLVGVTGSITYGTPPDLVLPLPESANW